MRNDNTQRLSDKRFRLDEAFDLLLPPEIRERDWAPQQKLLVMYQRSCEPRDGALWKTTIGRLARPILELSERRTEVHISAISESNYWTVISRQGNTGGIDIRINGVQAMLPPGTKIRRSPRDDPQAGPRMWIESLDDEADRPAVGSINDTASNAADGAAETGGYDAELDAVVENCAGNAGLNQSAQASAASAFNSGAALRKTGTGPVPVPVPVPETGCIDQRALPRDWRAFPLLVEAEPRRIACLPSNTIHNGIFQPLSESHLNEVETPMLIEWFRRQLSAARPVLGNSEAELLLLLAAARYAWALRPADIRKNRVAAFIDVVAKQKWQKALPFLPDARKVLDRALEWLASRGKCIRMEADHREKPR